MGLHAAFYPGQLCPPSSGHSEAEPVPSKQLLPPPALNSFHESCVGLESSSLLAQLGAHIWLSVSVYSYMWKPGAQGMALGLLKSPALISAPYIGPHRHVPTPYCLLRSAVPVCILPGILTLSNAALLSSAPVGLL